MATGPSHEMQSADHEPTLVMGASIVMEWIRAIEECLRCELPGGVKNNKMTLTFKFANKRKYWIFLRLA